MTASSRSYVVLVIVYCYFHGVFRIILCRMWCRVDEFVKLTDSGSGGKKGVMSAPATRGVSWKHPKPLPQVSNANPSSGMTASSTVASRSSSAASTASQGQHSNEVIITNNVTGGGNVSGMSDTYISSNSVKAALCAAGCACRAVDIVMTSNKSVAKDSSNTESTGINCIDF